MMRPITKKEGNNPDRALPNRAFESTMKLRRRTAGGRRPLRGNRCTVRFALAVAMRRVSDTGKYVGETRTRCRISSVCRSRFRHLRAEPT